MKQSQTDVVSGTGGRVEIALANVREGVGGHVFRVASYVVDGVNIRTFCGLVSDVEDEQIQLAVGLEFPFLNLRSSGIKPVGVIRPCLCPVGGHVVGETCAAVGHAVEGSLAVNLAVFRRELNGQLVPREGGVHVGCVAVVVV